MGADRGQPSHRITLRLEPRTLFLLALLLLALGSVAHGLAQAVRDLDTWLLLTVAILGVLAGWMMAALHLPGWLAGVSASLLGIEVVLGRVGRLDRKLTAVGQALINLLWEIGRWLLSWKIEKGQWELTGPPPNWIAVSQTLAELWAAVNTLLHRGYQWLLGFMAGRPAFDPVAAALGRLDSAPPPALAGHSPGRRTVGHDPRLHESQAHYPVGSAGRDLAADGHGSARCP